MRRGCLLLLVLLTRSSANADEAVYHDGRRSVGTCRKSEFLPINATRPVPFEEVHSVGFPAFPAPRPQARLFHQLLFHGDQRLAGELVSVGPKDVQFRLAGGETLKLARRHVRGVVQANNHIIHTTEDFERPLSGVWSGNPILSEDHVFSGRKSLLVESGSKEVAWAFATPEKRRGDWRATIYFFDPGSIQAAGARIQFVFQSPGGAVSFSLNSQRYRQEKAGHLRLKASPGWHVLQLDKSAGEIRSFIDDFFLGSQEVPAQNGLASLRLSFEGQGRIWLDAFSLANVTSPLQRSPGPPELDETWFASGAQVFGDLIGADDRAVVLNTRLGKRTLPWRDLRGIFFRSEGKPVFSGRSAEVRFRSAPGFPADQLNGELADLNEERILLRHVVLGEIAVARTRLDRITFPASKAKP
jgi:hypothetical protein